MEKPFIGVIIIFVIIELLPSSYTILFPTSNIDGSTFPKFILLEPSGIGSSNANSAKTVSFDFTVFSFGITAFSFGVNVGLSFGFITETVELFFCNKIGVVYIL